MTKHESNESAERAPTGEPTIPSVEQLLARLAVLGLPCPRHLTLQRYLRTLSRSGLTEIGRTETLLELYQQTVYAAAEDQDQQLAAVAEQINTEIEAAIAAGDRAEILERVTVQLQPSPAAPRPVPSADSHGINSSTEPPDGWAPPVDEPEPEPEPPAPQQIIAEAENEVRVELPPPPTLSLPWQPSRSRLLVVAALLLWSVLMVALGYVGQSSIRRAYVVARAKLYGYPPPPPNVPAAIERIRQQAGNHPESVAAWRSYANQARRFGYDTDAIVAYHHLLTRRPGDAKLLNRLAWLHCTSRDPHARDPIQALALAEQAHALSQEVLITDTLAEAAFQNGDIDRAIALEEDVLRRAHGNRSYFKRQLEKFKRGGPR